MPRRARSGWRLIVCSVMASGLALGVMALGSVQPASAQPASVQPAPASPASAASAPTFTRDVAPILQAKCQACHRPGYSAPMSLVDYDEVRPWSRAIRARVTDRQMPPWHIDKTVGIQAFENDRSLTDAEIATITRWAQSGAPRGNPSDLPPPKTFADDDGWNFAAQFGPPDLVLKSQPFTMPAQGMDVWWRPVTPTGLTEDRWVRAIEIKPSTPEGRRVTHRALVRLKQAGDGDDRATQPGLLTEWVVGGAGEVLPPDTGRLMKAGAAIAWDIHYHAVGEAATDQMRLGIYFYPKGQEPKWRQSLENLTSVAGGAREMDLPPNTTLVTERVHELARAGRVESFAPHMLWRGAAMAIEAVFPDGRTTVLSRVRNFSFNWQTNYVYARNAAPLLPKGTKLRVTSWYDNTANNRANPDPNQWVGWGERAVDEVGEAWLTITYLSDQDFESEVRRRAASADVAPGAVAIAPGQPAGQTPLKLEAPKQSGGGVTGAFEGWFPNADGTFTLLVGYMNRNMNETLDIAIGPNNRIEPGGPDRGQPTHFSSRRQFGMFTIVVPKDFAATTKQLQWTLTANGQTTVIPLALHPEYQVEPQRDVSTGNTPPVLRFTKGGAAMQGPVRPLASGGSGATYSGRVGQPVELRAFIADDMLADPGAVPGVPASGSSAAEQPPLGVTWSKFRGPGAVAFKKARPPVAHATDGAATTTAVFSAAGDYVLRVAANDASGEGGGGFQCCWTSAYAKVSVKP